MNLELACSILDILETMQDAVKQMKKAYICGDISEFHLLSSDLRDGLTAVRNIASQDETGDSVYRLKDGCTCALLSLKDIETLLSHKSEEVPWKLECELLTFIEEIYLKFFYYKIVQEDPKRKEELLRRVVMTGRYSRLLQNETERTYTCDLSIYMPAYNHLDYSKLCIESILRNVPKEITCELVLLNNGSSDGTREYFESISGAHVINLPINKLFPLAGMHAMGGKYSLYVSNDIVIGENAIENMYRAISEHSDYGWIVPSTSAVSNLQSLSIGYRSLEEFHAFAARNNIYDESRHEMRVRLCNPVTMIPTDRYNQLQLDLYEEMFCVQNTSSFPDDKISLWMRRHGYKSILEKDAYCHHFGSITHRDDFNSKQKWDGFYLQGRKTFVKNFGVDPWGTGFCHDSVFEERIVDIGHGHVDILGINCGLGANALKIKEQLKEYCHNTDCTLTYLADDACFLPDLEGISDQAAVVSSIKNLKNALYQHTFQYIVWETPFLEKYKFRTLLELCLKHLDTEGQLLIKLTGQSQKSIETNLSAYQRLGNGWALIRKTEWLQSTPPEA